MGLFKGFLMSLGMFSVIPVPKNSWNDRYMPLVIPTLPLVGALVGLIWYGLSVMLVKNMTPSLIQGAIVLFIPFLLTGFIHADGFMDTADAVLSRRGLEEKKRILKDPNIGAFSVFAIIVVTLSQFCAVQTILSEHKALIALIFIPVISRCVTGVAMLNLKPVFETGYNVSFRNNTKPLHSVFIVLLTVAILSASRFAPGLALPLFTETAACALTAFYLYKQFDGISGDLCGCIITTGEFAALVCMAVTR